MNAIEAGQSNAKKERSPAYPFIPLGTAIERLKAFDEYFKRHPAPADKVGLAWEMKPQSSQAAQTLAALKSFGLVEYEGAGTARKASLTEDARTYLRAQQDAVKKAVLRRVALNPKALAKYWAMWGADRPPDPVCLDELVLKGAFTQSAAETFLRVYDNTIAYAGLANSDTLRGEGERDEPPLPAKPKVGDLVQWESQGQLQFAEHRRVRAVTEDGDAIWVFVEGSETGIPASEITVQQAAPELNSPSRPGVPPRLPEMTSEREWLRGPLSKESSYRLLVHGDLGPREISKLIKLLEAQRLVLSDDDEEAN